MKARFSYVFKTKLLVDVFAVDVEASVKGVQEHLHLSFNIPPTADMLYVLAALQKEYPDITDEAWALIEGRNSADAGAA